MSNQIIFFTDMDDTIIQTKRKTDFSKEIEVGGYNKDGEESSFYYSGTKLFIDKLLEANITLIPTTARSLNSYYRTTLSKDNRIKYAILNFGAMILVDNKIDTQWKEKIEKKLKSISLFSISEDIINILDKSLTIKIIDDFYINIHNKVGLDNKSIKETLDNYLVNRDEFYLHHNDNSFAILPKCINKSFAVEYMIDKLNPILSLGAGDNRSDLDFMNITDFRVIPKKTSINML